MTARKHAVTLLAAGLVIAGPVWAQMTPVGTWHSIDDATGEPKAQIVINEDGGVLNGHIEKLLRPDADPNGVCDRCTDDRKGQRILGMEIIRGAKQDESASADQPVWKGGTILDPEKGSTYALKLTPTDSGQKLEVRGSIGPFGRTQTWVRVN